MRSSAIALILWIAAAMAMGTVALAERREPLPKELQDVAITEHLDAQLPLDLPFVSSDGRKVVLKDFFDGRRPVILTMNYSNCPMLCSLQLNGLVESMQKMTWDLGTQYQVVTVSIDPLETPERAALTKQKYLRQYGRPQAVEGWNFLVGREENIKELAQTVGFGYVYVPEQKQFVHMAVLMICTPEGRVSRYLGGVKYDPQTLRLTLLEASQGKIGSVMDQVLLYCFHYDADSHRYGPSAASFMRIGGVLTLVVLGGMLSVYWLRELRRAKAAPSKEPL
jgi:protein SCO1